jgi:hypothetical protein
LPEETGKKGKRKTNPSTPALAIDWSKLPAEAHRLISAVKKGKMSWRTLPKEVRLATLITTWRQLGQMLPPDLSENLIDSPDGGQSNA